MIHATPLQSFDEDLEPARFHDPGLRKAVEALSLAHSPTPAPSDANATKKRKIAVQENAALSHITSAIYETLDATSSDVGDCSVSEQVFLYDFTLQSTVG